MDVEVGLAMGTQSMSTRRDTGDVRPYLQGRQAGSMVFFVRRIFDRDWRSIFRAQKPSTEAVGVWIHGRHRMKLIVTRNGRRARPVQLGADDDGP